LTDVVVGVVEPDVLVLVVALALTGVVVVVVVEAGVVVGVVVSPVRAWTSWRNDSRLVISDW
jgi:hypothetical protein